jgi:hypothetical protein
MDLKERELLGGDLIQSFSIWSLASFVFSDKAAFRFHDYINYKNWTPWSESASEL